MSAKWLVPLVLLALGLLGSAVWGWQEHTARRTAEHKGVKLQEAVNDQRDELESARQELAGVKARLARTLDQVLSLQAESARLSQEGERVQRILKNQEKELGEQRARSAVLAEAQAAKEAEAAALREKLGGAQARSGDLAKAQEAAAATQADLQKKAEAAQKSQSKLAGSLKEAQSELDSAKRVAQQAEQAARTLRDQVHARDQEIARLQAALQKENDDDARLTSDNDKLRKENDKLNKDIANLRNELARLQGRITSGKR